MKKLILVATVLGLLGGLIVTPLAGAACSGRATSAEKSFTSKLNRERAERGLVKLRLDPQVSKAAKLHTKEMIAKNTIHHTPNNVLAKRVTNWVVLGENVGAGASVSSLHKAFMKSQSHRENILFPDFRHVGVGAKKTGDGKLWVTFIFEAKKDPGTTVQDC